MRISIGITAYNEEANIGRLLEAVFGQRREICRIIEIIVIASGCTDRTVPIVKEFINNPSSKSSKSPSPLRGEGRGEGLSFPPVIKLIEQEKREGKASAINLFIKEAKGEILILESADTLPISNTCDNLAKAFLNPETGMCGGRPMPLNSPHNFIGYAAHFLWGLHHRLALHEPKLGEMVAFRNVVDEIPKNTAVDEASLEAIVIQKGYKLKYVPEAIVLNKGPETVSDFLKQRRRIANGHLHLKHSQGYVTSTMGHGLIGQVVKEAFLIKIQRLKKLVKRKRYKDFNLCLAGYAKYGIWSLGVILLEIWGRAVGSYDFYFAKRNPVVWDIAGTTKNLGKN